MSVFPPPLALSGVSLVLTNSISYTTIDFLPLCYVSFPSYGLVITTPARFSFLYSVNSCRSDDKNKVYSLYQPHPNRVPYVRTSTILLTLFTRESILSPAHHHRVATKCGVFDSLIALPPRPCGTPQCVGHINTS